MPCLRVRDILMQLFCHAMEKWIECFAILQHSLHEYFSTALVIQSRDGRLGCKVECFNMNNDLREINLWKSFYKG